MSVVNRIVSLAMDAYDRIVDRERVLTIGSATFYPTRYHDGGARRPWGQVWIRSSRTFVVWIGTDVYVSENATPWHHSARDVFGNRVARNARQGGGCHCEFCNPGLHAGVN